MNVPAELLDYPNWVAYKLVPSTKHPGKMDKLPVNPHTGAMAATDNPKTWGTFDQAMQCKTRLRIAGVGFVFTGTPFCGVDLDACRDKATGVIQEWAADHIRLLASYTEASPSGTGVHIILCGKLPPGRRRVGKVEMYDTGRYFTFTGDVVPDTPATIRADDGVLAEFHRRVFGEPAPAAKGKVPEPAPAAETPDDVLLNRMAAAENNEKIMSLMGGKWDGYPSQSEADMALCHHLAFWTRKNRTQMDRLFRASGLMRDKWDTKRGDSTYGDITITNAIEACTTVYRHTHSGNGTDPGTPASGCELKTWEDADQTLGEMSWAWYPWLPNGLLTMIVAQQGEGKSILMLRLAACFLRGDNWPDNSPFLGDTGDVLWVETEASQGLNIERAKAWGVPLDQVIVPLEDPLDDAILDDEEHQAQITMKASRKEVKAIFVDSLSGGNRRDENSSGTLQTIKWLAELARNLGKPAVLSHHLRKRSILDVGGSLITLDQVRGSSAITQVARVVWGLDQPDSSVPTRRISVVKYNLGRKPEAIGMTIHDKGVSFDSTAPDVPRSETQIDKAIDLLRALLAHHPVAQTEIEREAEGAGISMITMRRAKDKIGVIARKDPAGPWRWSLPAYVEVPFP